MAEKAKVQEPQELKFDPPPGFESRPAGEVWKSKVGDSVSGKIMNQKHIVFKSSGKSGLTVELDTGGKIFVVNVNEHTIGDYEALQPSVGDILYIKHVQDIQTGKGNPMKGLRFAVKRAPVVKVAEVDDTPDFG